MSLSAPHALSRPQSPNQFGGSVDLEPGKRRTAIQPRGEDFEGQVVTIGIAPVVHPPGEVLDLLAHIQWGVGGTSEEVSVDVKRGFQLTIAGTGVRVDVENRGAPGTSTAHASAVIAYGTRPSGFRPTFTQSLGPVNPGASSAEQAIPNRASTVQLLSDQRGYPLYLVGFRAVTAGALLYEPGPASITDELPISNTARFVVVQNTAAARAELVLLYNLTI